MEQILKSISAKNICIFFVIDVLTLRKKKPKLSQTFRFQNLPIPK